MLSNLELIYQEINQRLEKLNFQSIWPNFHRFDFALYDNNQVFYNNDYYSKTDEFIGNTSIEFQGKQIAIWNISKSSYDFDLLTSSIVHEMFHAFQQEQNDLRFPNEFIGLSYPSNSENYNYKYNENLLLVELFNHFSDENFINLINSKRKRKSKIGQFFEYETKIEIWEGMAVYVELSTLKILDEIKYNEVIKQLINRLSNIENIFDIRKISYDTGALFLIILDSNNIYYDKSLKIKQTIFDILEKNVSNQDVYFEENQVINNKTDEWVEKKKKLVMNVLTKASFSCEVNSLLAGYDPYNARKYNNYIYHPYFIGLKDDNGKFEILYGTYVTKMKDDSIRVSKYYKL